ncbi:MAG: prepilin-type N-terminal cleavage/methylation domain-containing protein, partial [Minisyncoccia bacterium]
MPNNKKGFTLIELLVVMGILGILMAVTILVINPAEYLRRSRDT